MYYTLCRIYRDPDGSMKEKEASKTPKGVMIEHKGGEFILCHYNPKGRKQAF